MLRPIVFFDSGIGGLPYLVHLKERLPGEDFIYVADSKYFPYGDKEVHTLIKIITETIKRILDKFNPKIIVVACNTASVTALDHIRNLTNVPIIGVVPAVKTASERTKNNKIGILATNRTVKGNYLQQLISEFSSDKEVVSVGASGIVDFVEKNLCFAKDIEIQHFIDKSVVKLKEHGVDSVVLGCTHFIHVSKEISHALGDNVEVIDSREGVSNQISRVLDGMNNTTCSLGKGYFYLTEMIENISNYKILSKQAGLEFMGEMKY